MSQEKVDRHKKEKKNRERDKKIKKLKQALAAFICAILIGAIIGIPLGKKLYNDKKKKDAEKEAKVVKYIPAVEFKNWFNDYYVEKYYDLYAGMTLATNPDAPVSESEK